MGVWVQQLLLKVPLEINYKMQSVKPSFMSLFLFLVGVSMLLLAWSFPFLESFRFSPFLFFIPVEYRSLFDYYFRNRRNKKNKKG